MTGFKALKKFFSAKKMLKNQIKDYIDALEKFAPETNCGKWYKDAYLALLAAGQDCDNTGCAKIDAPHLGQGNTNAELCYADLAEGKALSTPAANWRMFALKLSNDCTALAVNCQCSKAP